MYTMDASLFGRAAPKPKYTLSVKDMATLRRIAGTHPNARRKVADAAPMSAEEAEAAHKSEMQRKNLAKLREQRDAQLARSQAIADGLKDAVRKIWPNAWRGK
ncbi:hypothetical protein [Rhodoblastus sp.]|uniref:hypothetical protein n=1 Tax=Rhodoblastus sp. TaxID=1962975 RepID=UPI003F96A606